MNRQRRRVRPVTDRLPLGRRRPLSRRCSRRSPGEAVVLEADLAARLRTLHALLERRGEAPFDNAAELARWLLERELDRHERGDA